MDESNRTPEEGKQEEMDETNMNPPAMGSSTAVTTVTAPDAPPPEQASQVTETTEQITETDPNVSITLENPTQIDTEAAPEGTELRAAGGQEIPSHGLMTQGLLSSSPPAAFLERRTSKTSTRSSSGQHDDSSLDSAHNHDEEEERPPEEFATAEAARLYQERMKQKREKRLAMNRASARERRRRKKLLIDSLQKQVEDLEDKVEELEGANSRLRDYVGRLEIDLARAQNALATGKGQSVPSTNMQAGLAGGLNNTPLGASLVASASRQPTAGLNQASLFGQQQQAQQQQSSAMNQRGSSSSSMGMAVSQRADEALQSLIQAQQRKQQQEQQAAAAAALRNQLGGASASSLFSQQYQSSLGLGSDPRLLDASVLAREEARETAALQQQQQREALLMQQLAAGQNLSLGQQDLASFQAQLQSQQQSQHQSGLSLADQLLLARQHGLLGGASANQLATNALTAASASRYQQYSDSLQAALLGGGRSADYARQHQGASQRGDDHRASSQGQHRYSGAELAQRQWTRDDSSHGSHSRRHSGGSSGMGSPQQPYKKRMKMLHPDEEG